MSLTAIKATGYEPFYFFIVTLKPVFISGFVKVEIQNNQIELYEENEGRVFQERLPN